MNSTVDGDNFPIVICVDEDLEDTDEEEYQPPLDDDDEVDEKGVGVGVEVVISDVDEDNYDENAGLRDENDQNIIGNNGNDIKGEYLYCNNHLSNNIKKSFIIITVVVIIRSVR